MFKVILETFLQGIVYVSALYKNIIHDSNKIKIT